MFTAVLAGIALSAAIHVAAQDATAPRLRDGGLPSGIPRALGGGEVVLELTINPQGAVQRLDRLLTTPPYTELLARAVAGWRFDRAITMVGEKRTAGTGHVLVAAVFRPPLLYAGPSAGTSPVSMGVPSAYVPSPAALVLPAYPPTAVGMRWC